MKKTIYDRAGTGKPVPIHDAAAFAAMHKAGELAARTLDYITPFVEPGVRTNDLDTKIEQFMRDHGGVPATLGYKGYPASSGISINHVVNHGIPDEKDLKRLRRGAVLDGQKTGPIEAAIERSTGKSCYLTLTLTEGKYRHIKRACELIGHPVVKLARTGFGGLELSSLSMGAFRFLTPQELKTLRRLGRPSRKTEVA